MQTTQMITHGMAGSSASLHQVYTVLIADHHPVVREGLATRINGRSDMRVVAEATDGQEAVEKFLAHSPDIALLELRLPIMDGVEAVMSICEKMPAARLVIFTTCKGEEDIYRAVKAGAFGYLLKEAPLNEVIECIRAVARGTRWIPPGVAAMLGKRVADRALTARELEVIRISEATVKVHITHILEKLKVTGRTEAINVAMRRGLVHIDSPAVA